MIDTGTNTVVATVQVSSSLTFGVAVNPAGTRVYVASDNGLRVIDTATSAVVATVAINNPHGLAVR